MILVIEISFCMCLFPYPSIEIWDKTVSGAAYLWFEIEMGVFVGNII